MKQLKNFLSFLIILFLQQVAEASDNIHFLTLADIHFDPFVACHQVRGKCPLILNLRQATVSQWEHILSTGDETRPAYREDTNYRLLKSALNAASVAAREKQVKFVIVLGDVIGHNFRRNYIRCSNDPSIIGYQAFVKKTLQFMTRQFAEAFPNINIYSVVGNNDTYQRDYVNIPKGLFFNDVSDWWGSLIKTKVTRNTMQKEFSKAGYYAVDLPEIPNVKLIVLNTVLFSYRAKGLGVQNTAQEELSWFDNELKIANTHHQKVLIAMHIPEAIDVYATISFRLFRLVELWQTSYIKQYQSTLNMFASEIAGIMSGHLHSDWFQLLNVSDQYQIPVAGTPSISPIFGNNPGFKIYTYSLKTQQLEEGTTEILPLDDQKANQFIWQKVSHAAQFACYQCRISDNNQAII